MKFLPFENISFKTKLSVQEVLKRFSKNVEPPGQDWGRIFEGTISKNQFEMIRNIWYNNSFLPVLTGEITSGIGETIVNVKLRLRLFVLIFTCFLCLFAIALGILFWFVAIIPSQDWYFKLFPLIFIVWTYLLTTVCFNLECRKAKKELAKIIEGEIIEF